MNICRVSQEELANDNGDAGPDQVRGIDFRHEEEYAERFFDEIVNDTATIKAVIDLVRKPSIENIAALRVLAIQLSEEAAKELSA